VSSPSRVEKRWLRPCTTMEGNATARCWLTFSLRRHHLSVTLQSVISRNVPSIGAHPYKGLNIIRSRCLDLVSRVLSGNKAELPRDFRSTMDDGLSLEGHRKRPAEEHCDDAINTASDDQTPTIRSHARGPRPCGCDLRGRHHDRFRRGRR
jgi:hypothetical protein